ncbi:peptidase S10 [Novosphingobium sp.]|uniref:S10 family serine carboxypeptidase-like protein n=1 Tax=Novosphingobium sp. TaxID=1874826 RepID=UPI001EC888A1|nr:peptidase S10 [Novosphingobium sp.]MBK6799968.1 peptidase S10 [Novosphingobium sp.]MBK9011018.1 peptidase S10 [Novosphingobium sp.]
MGVKLGFAVGLALAALASPALARAVKAAESGCAGEVVAARQHRGTFNGQRITYVSCVERYATLDTAGQPAARITAISYVARKARPDRPVLFVFNGGPIVASYILHMGAFGPKRLAVPDDISASPDQFRLVDNPHAPLDVADVVFFDPAGTGLSEPAPGVSPASQFSVTADARQLQQLVLGWTRAHGRETAPVYLVGESYGTLRAPAAAQQLLDAGRAPAGVILIGQAVNIIEYAQRPGNIISYAVSLPTLAATAWWHGKAERRGRGFDQFMADAKAFGGGEYLSVLFAGDSASPERQRAVANELQAFTGIAAEEWLRRRLRMSKVDYQRALFPGERLATNDARYRGPASGPDPFSPVADAYGHQFTRYLASDLGIDAAGYRLAHPGVGGLESWDWGPNKTPFGDWPYGAAITALMNGNPDFRLLVGNGYYDTQTTVGAMDYLVNQGGWPRQRVRSVTYQGGHMPYSIEASLAELSRDVRAMVRKEW